MGRVVAYVRVSTDKQELENQRFEIERFCRERSLAVDEWDGEIISGTVKVSERKLAAVLDSLTAGDTLIMAEVSRIARSLLGILMVVQECVDRGITLMTVKENFTFGGDLNSKVMAAVFGIAAEIERSLISARTREALARKKAEGIRLGRPVGTGRPELLKLYGKDEKILRLMEKRVSYAAIARILDVNPKTLRAYLERQNLREQLRWRQFKEMDV